MSQSPLFFAVTVIVIGLSLITLLEETTANMVNVGGIGGVGSTFDVRTQSGYTKPFSGTCSMSSEDKVCDKV